MIQRIQTVFILLSMLITGMYFTNPLARILGPDNAVYFYSFRGFHAAGEKAEITSEALPLIILLAVILLLSLVTIFLFRRRVLQARFCMYNILLKLGLLGMVAFQLLHFRKQEEAVSLAVTWIALMPLAAAFFDYLAYRNIRKDELLVRSIDRIR